MDEERPLSVTVFGIIVIILGASFILLGLWMILFVVPFAIILFFIGACLICFGLVMLIFYKPFLEIERSLNKFWYIFLIIALIGAFISGSAPDIIFYIIAGLFALVYWYDRKANPQIYGDIEENHPDEKLEPSKRLQHHNYNCPYCGSRNIDVYSDGAGVCNLCREAFMEAEVKKKSKPNKPRNPST